MKAVKVLSQKCSTILIHVPSETTSFRNNHLKQPASAANAAEYEIVTDQKIILLIFGDYKTKVCQNRKVNLSNEES